MLPLSSKFCFVCLRAFLRKQSFAYNVPKITFAATATAKSGHVEYPLGTAIDFTTSRLNDWDISAKKGMMFYGLKRLD